MKTYISPSMKVIELAQEELICTSNVDETSVSDRYHVKSRSFFDDED